MGSVALARRDLLALGVVLLALTATAGAAFGLGYLPGPRYEAATVVVGEGDETLATVDVRVADTFAERYRGLSETDSLAPGEGMLFVHESAGEHAYVMRGMAYPLDIVFMSADGRVTAVRHAPVPERTPGDELRRYRGHGKYVLELPRGYANRTGISVGDRVAIRGR